MKKAILFLVLILAASLIFWKLFKSKDGEKQNADNKGLAISIKKHSEDFNKSIGRVVDKYMNIKDAFVNADTAAIKLHGGEFILLLDAIDTSELKKDSSAIEATVISAISDLKSNAVSMLSQSDITEMRKDFSSLTDVMFPGFFIAIKYEGPTLYIHNCPMAFNDEIPANWISTSEEVINPYLGKNHPKYKAGMLHCGEVVDSVKSK